MPGDANAVALGDQRGVREHLAGAPVERSGAGDHLLPPLDDRLRDVRVQREAVGHRRERIRRLVDQRGDELLLGARIERDVEQQDRQPRPAHVTGPAGIGRELEQSGAIGDRGRRELRFEAGQEGGDVCESLVLGSWSLVRPWSFVHRVDGPRTENQGRRTDAGEPQLVQRTCESLRKSR